MTPLTCPWCGSDDLVAVFDDPASGDASNEVVAPDDDGAHPWPADASNAHCRACDHHWSPLSAPVELVVDDEERLECGEWAAVTDAELDELISCMPARQRTTTTLRSSGPAIRA